MFAQQPILNCKGSMNFFAGPTDNQFKAEVNLYNVHYTSVHVLGTTGGNNDDLIAANDLRPKENHGYRTKYRG